MKVIIVPEEGSTIAERDILSECARRLENFMVPKLVQITDAQKTATGKIKKTGLS